MASSSTATNTSTIDPLVANILAQRARRSSAASSTSSTSSTSLDALLSDPKDPISSAYRAQRLEQLSQLLSATRAATTTSSATSTTTVTTHTHEKDLMNSVAAAPRAVVHFFRTAFARCGIMDSHLARLAAAHGATTLFARIDAASAPFLCERLAVRELPCVVGYVAGEMVERLVGFEGLGGDGFGTGVLERRLVERGVLLVEMVGDGEAVEVERRKRREDLQRRKDEEVDDDWDD